MSVEHRLLRRRDYRAVPWKNGGGTTHEVLRTPPEPTAFEWRVSVAQIDRPGPFSDFSGYRRHMALLAGQGVRLRFSHATCDLEQPGDLIEFDGGEAVHCELKDGSCTDLNLMVAHAMPSAVRVLPLETPLSLAPHPGGHAFVFALGPMRVQGSDLAPVLLEAWDSLWWQGGERQLIPCAAGGAPSRLFFATIGHGSPSAADARRP